MIITSEMQSLNGFPGGLTAIIRPARPNQVQERTPTEGNGRRDSICHIIIVPNSSGCSGWKSQGSFHAQTWPVATNGILGGWEGHYWSGTRLNYCDDEKKFVTSRKMPSSTGVRSRMYGW